MATKKKLDPTVRRIIDFKNMIRLGNTTTRQTVLLLAISKDPNILTIELARILDTTHSNIRETAKKLKKKGLMDWALIPGLKKKRVRYWLTETGRELVKYAKGGRR